MLLPMCLFIMCLTHLSQQFALQDVGCAGCDTKLLQKVALCFRHAMLCWGNKSSPIGLIIYHLHLQNEGSSVQRA